MKRVFALMLVLVICGAFFACSSEEAESEAPSITDEVVDYVRFRVAIGYDIVGLPQVTTYVTENYDGTYTVTGKVTVRDKYGDTYTGKYSAEVEETETGYDVTSCDIDSLYKD